MEEAFPLAELADPCILATEQVEHRLDQFVFGLRFVQCRVGPEGSVMRSQPADECVQGSVGQLSPSLRLLNAAQQDIGGEQLALHGLAAVSPTGRHLRVLHGLLILPGPCEIAAKASQ
jgi:hypothetical protein